MIANLPNGGDICEIEIEPTSACTRRCWFCDPGIPPSRRTSPDVTPVGAVEALAEELAELDYAGLITFCGLGEPFLHENLLALTQAARRVPRASVMVYTNGDVATETLLRAMAPSIDTLVFSDYDDNAVLAKGFGRILGKKLRHERHAGKPYTFYHSRAGNVPAAGRPRRFGIVNCNWFQRHLFRAAAGYWTTCCNDMAHENRWMGGVRDLFAHPGYRAFRAELAAGGRSRLSPCLNCEAPR